MPKWGDGLDEGGRREQFKLIYDYIKFHMGLYLATPPLVALVASSLSIEGSKCFLGSLGLMIAIFAVSGAHASLFMARHVNDPWQKDYLDRFEQDAFSTTRRTMHHLLYWIGIGVGITGLVLAFVAKHANCLALCR